MGLSIEKYCFFENSLSFRFLGKPKKRSTSSKKGLITVMKIGQLVDGQLPNITFLTKRQGETPGLKPSINIVFASILSVFPLLVDTLYVFLARRSFKRLSGKALVQ